MRHSKTRARQVERAKKNNKVYTDQIHKLFSYGHENWLSIFLTSFLAIVTFWGLF